MLTQERLRELVTYDPETGIFTYNVRRIGRYNCPTAAHIAYINAAKKHFGEFARY